MSLTNFDKIFDVEDSEYGYASETFRPGRNTIPIYVPKLMGAINGTGSDNVNAITMFDNDDGCKITYSKKVFRTNSFSPVVQKGCTWIDKVNSSGYIKKGTRFLIKFLNGNVSSPYVTNR